MRSDLVPGAVFPAYQLLDHTSTPRRLSELQSFRLAARQIKPAALTVSATLFTGTLN